MSMLSEVLRHRSGIQRSEVARSRAPQEVTGRPVMSREQILTLGRRILDMVSTADAQVVITHTALATTRFARSSMRSGDDGNALEIEVWTEFGDRLVYMETNQGDDRVLERLVQWCEATTRGQTDSPELLRGIQHEVQDTYLPVQLWHESTVEAMRNSRATLLPKLVQPISARGLRASGFVGFMARSQGTVSKEGIQAFYDETDCEVSVAARTVDNTSSGWAGRAVRNWSDLDPDPLAAQAVDLAERGVNPRAVEPGRWTVILTREAVAQLFRYFAYFYDYYFTVLGQTPMSKKPYPVHEQNTKIGLRIFDSRINMKADPTDPEGGFAPFFGGARGVGYANPVLQLVENGILVDLARSPGLAEPAGKAYAEDPSGLRVSGGTTTIEEMVKSCSKGIYVNRFSNVDLISPTTGMMTGVTRDGCFLIKNGKFETPVKNFRFVDSPMFVLNKILALGEPKRAAYGYTPRSSTELLDPRQSNWPRRPIIVPPMMVQDFEFTSLADAV